MQRQNTREDNLSETYRFLDDSFDGAKAKICELSLSSTNYATVMNLYGFKDQLKKDYKELAAISSRMDEHKEKYDDAVRAIKHITAALDIIKHLLQSRQKPEIAITELKRMVDAYVELCEAANWHENAFEAEKNKFNEIMYALNQVIRVIKDQQKITPHDEESKAIFLMRTMVVRMTEKLISKSTHIEEAFGVYAKWCSDLKSKIAMLYDVFIALPVKLTTCWPDEKYRAEIGNMHAEYAKILAADKLKKSRDADVAASSSQASSSTTSAAAQESAFDLDALFRELDKQFVSGLKLLSPESSLMSNDSKSVTVNFLNKYKAKFERHYADLVSIRDGISRSKDEVARGYDAVKGVSDAVNVIREHCDAKSIASREIALFELKKLVNFYAELCSSNAWFDGEFKPLNNQLADVVSGVKQDISDMTRLHQGFEARALELAVIAWASSMSGILKEQEGFIDIIKSFTAQMHEGFIRMPEKLTVHWPDQEFKYEIGKIHAEYAKMPGFSPEQNHAKEPDANVSQPASTRSTPKVQEAISSSSASTLAAIAFERDAVNTVEAQLEQLMRLFALCDSELAVVLENIKDTQNRNVCVGVVRIIDRSRNEMPANLRDLVALKQEIVSYHAKQNEAKELVVDIERRINYVKMDAARTNRPNNTIAALGELADNYVELQELLAELDDLAVHVEKEFEAKLKDHESMMGRLRMTCERIDAEEKFQPVGEYAQVFMRVSKTMLGLIQEKAKSFADVAAERVALKTKLDGFSLEVKALPRLITDKWTDRVYFQRIARCHPIYAEDPVYGNSLTPQARQRDEVDGGRDNSNVVSPSVAAAVSPQSAPRASIANNGRLVQGTLHAATQATSSQNQAQQAHAQAHRDNTRSNKCCIIM